MGSTKTGPSWADAYDPAEFARKHGITRRQAKIVIRANGPSKVKCDLAARAFISAFRQCAHLREGRRMGTDSQ